MDFKITRSLVYIPDSKSLRENFREMRIFHRRHPREVKSFTHRVSGRTKNLGKLLAALWAELSSRVLVCAAYSDVGNVSVSHGILMILASGGG